MLEKTRTTAVDALANSPQYMPGFGNDFETETLPGALPQGQNAAAMRLWPLCRTTVGLALHGAARHQ